ERSDRERERERGRGNKKVRETRRCVWTEGTRLCFTLYELARVFPLAVCARYCTAIRQMCVCVCVCVRATVQPYYRCVCVSVCVCATVQPYYRCVCVCVCVCVRVCVRQRLSL